MRPRSAAPFFTLTALVHLAAVASFFPEVAVRLPDVAPLWLAFLHGPLLLLGGYFEGQLVYRESSVSLPQWMLITSRPVKWSFTLAFIYLTLLTLEHWNIGLRGLRPMGPAEWPLRTRALFFVAMTLGLAFVYYLHASKLLIPLMRGLSWPARKLPRPLGLPLALALGAALGLAVAHAVTDTPVGETATVVDALLQAPGPWVVAALGGVVGLALLGAASLREA